jgi:hypothetical protein
MASSAKTMVWHAAVCGMAWRWQQAKTAAAWRRNVWRQLARHRRRWQLAAWRRRRSVGVMAMAPRGGGGNIINEVIAGVSPLHQKRRKRRKIMVANEGIEEYLGA